MKHTHPCLPRFAGRALLLAALVLSPCLVRAADTALDPADEAIGKSVVKVSTVVRYPDCFKPWAKQTPLDLVGSGVVIEGKRILANAHIVLYAEQIQVQADETGDKYSATVVGISPELDLALLKLDDESFFNNHPVLPRSTQLPKVADPVTDYGFPNGGFNLSVTKGKITRVEVAKYNYSASGLRLQLDAAINAGASGGPAVAGGKMIGMSIPYVSQTESLSHIIPCEEIDLFLNKLANGVYHGRPALFAKLQILQNSTLRSYLKLDKSVHGAVVQHVGRLPAGNPLQQWDVITAIGDSPIDDDGMVRAPNGLTLSFIYLFDKLAHDGKVPLTVLRAGKSLSLDVPVTANPDMVLPSLKGAFPDYFVDGPLVFSDASQDLLNQLLSSRMARTFLGILLDQGSPLLSRCDDFPAFHGERMVVVTSSFQHKLTRGYGDPAGQVIKSVNGTAINNLAQLVALLRDSKDPFLVIEFDGRNADTLIYPRADMASATDDILNDNSIRNQGSADMMTIWNLKKN